MTIVPVFLTIYIASGSRVVISKNEYAPSSILTTILIDSRILWPSSRNTPIHKETISVSV